MPENPMTDSGWNRRIIRPGVVDLLAGPDPDEALPYMPTTDECDAALAILAAERATITAAIELHEEHLVAMYGKHAIRRLADRARNVARPPDTDVA